MSHVTCILDALSADPSSSPDELLTVVYDELRRLAAGKMAQEQNGHTLQPTALVHEAWLRLMAGDHPRWQNRAHFFGAAAEAMRRILVENARRKLSLKRGGRRERVDLQEVELALTADDDRLLQVHEAVSRLEQQDPQAAALVKLRFFAGLSQQEAAQLLNLPDRTAGRLWAYARAWLFHELQETA